MPLGPGMGEVSAMEAAGSRFDRWVESVYRRTKSRYDWLLLGITIVAIQVVLVPLFIALYAAAWSQDFGDWPGIVLAIEIGAAGGTPTLLWVVRVHHRALIKYLRGEDGVDPVQVWITSVAELPQGILQAMVGYVVPILAANAYIGVGQGFSTTAHVATGAMVVIAVLGSGAFLFLFWEIALRPVVREIAPLLPDDLVLREGGLSLASKLLFLLASLGLFNGVAVGAASTNALTRDERLIVIVGTAILLSATLSGSMVWMIEHSFVSRIDELRRALQSMSSGQEIRLPPLAGDDLDEVGHAFNEMAERINQHESAMQASRARIVAVTDDERRRMERDLHDGAQQHLALLNLQLSMLERSTSDHPELAAKVDEMQSTLAAALAEMRDLAHGIYPASLENEGLAAALAEAAGRAALPTTLEVDGAGRVPREIETAVYFCCLEALQNASKYAGDSARATITLGQQNGTLNFAVTDDGVGFDLKADGHGLHNMQDRIGALGGEVTFESEPGRGFTVRGSVPVTLD